MQNSITTTHAYIPPQYNSTKEKSWDNLTKTYHAGVSNSGYITQIPHSQQIHHVVIPRKSTAAIAPPPYGRYYSEVENYVPAPQAFVHEKTITKTTIITTKSTENLISNAQSYNIDDSCECLVTPPKHAAKQQQLQECAACNAANFNNNVDQSYQGYYSNLTRTNPGRYIPTKTEITRL
jgi:hypothetical protein